MEVDAYYPNEGSGNQEVQRHVSGHGAAPAILLAAASEFLDVGHAATDKAGLLPEEPAYALVWAEPAPLLITALLCSRWLRYVSQSRYRPYKRPYPSSLHPKRL